MLTKQELIRHLVSEEEKDNLIANLLIIADWLFDNNEEKLCQVFRDSTQDDLLRQGLLYCLRNGYYPSDLYHGMESRRYYWYLQTDTGLMSPSHLPKSLFQLVSKFYYSKLAEYPLDLAGAFRLVGGALDEYSVLKSMK